jgi:outer membrane protein TolC
MTRWRLWMGLLALGIATCGTAEAQGNGPALRLSLPEAVARALEASEEVRAARAQQALAESRIVQTRADALPQVRATLGYTRTLASIFDDVGFPLVPEGPGFDFGGGLGDLPFGQRNAWTGSLLVSQPLYAGGAVRAAREVADHVRQAAGFDRQEVEIDLVLQVRRAYFEMSLSDQLVRIAEESRQVAEAHAERVRVLHARGAASDFDLLRAEVERDTLDPPVVSARNARRIAELTLVRLANLPPDRPIVPTTGLEPLLVDVDREALRAALDRRAALAALDETIAAREGGVRVARAARRPSVNTTGTFGFQSFSASPFDDIRRDWSVGVQMSVPIFDGARISGQIQQAQAEVDLARIQRADAREWLVVELEASLGEFDAARAQIAARRATTGQARRTLELAELRFRNGLATQLEVSDARLLLQQAQVNEVQAFADYITAVARLERVTGGELPLVERRLARVE